MKIEPRFSEEIRKISEELEEKTAENLTDFEEKTKNFQKILPAENFVENIIEHNPAAASFFDSYRIDGKIFLPVTKRREYYANAIVLDAVNKLVSNRNFRLELCRITGSRDLWTPIGEMVQELDRARYAHTLPSNKVYLAQKLKIYKKEGFESLIHKTYLATKKNAAKVASDDQVNILATLMSDPRNLDNSQIAMLYNSLTAKLNWKPITSATVGIWREKLSNEIYARRHGAVAYRNSKAMQVKRRAPEFPLYFWTLDGWDVELMYQAVEGNRTTYHNRPTVVIVLDACLKYPIGYAIGTHETPELIKKALQNAVKHTESLFGQMYRTAQLQSDNYAISRLTPIYEQISDKTTPAAVKNAKAKIIEPWFRYFNKKYCQLQPNWSGFGVTSRKELQPNVDFLNKFKKNFPDYEGVCQQVEAFIEAERASLREAFVQKWNEMPAENRFPLPYEQYLLNFGTATSRRTLMRGSGLSVTIGGVQRTFDCFDPEFRAYASTQWKVLYDPEDTSRALAVSEDERLQFALEAKHVQPMALIERQEGDYEQLRRVRDFNDKQEKRIAKQIGEYTEGAAQLLASHKELETLQKLMICDSAGQHKNRRNSERLKPISEQIQQAQTIEPDVFDTTDLYDEY